MFGHKYNDGMYDWMDSDERNEGVRKMNCMSDVVVDKAT
jgi:hypothetical protein